MLAYNRALCREEDPAHYTIEMHADDAAEIIGSEVGAACAVVGSSFGAAVALELARRSPQLVTSLVLCEPPMPQSDNLAALPYGFACKFDGLVASKGGPAAAEFFLRSVLGDESFEAMPKTFQKRSMEEWRQIRADMHALSRYRANYSGLREEIKCPVALVGGAKSAHFYREVLETLRLAIPGSDLRILRGAGHMMQVDAHRQFNALLRERFA